jgi:hypothetical protein
VSKCLYNFTGKFMNMFMMIVIMMNTFINRSSARLRKLGELAVFGDLFLLEERAPRLSKYF